jgi:hypothetical protein
LLHTREEQDHEDTQHRHEGQPCRISTQSPNRHEDVLGHPRGKDKGLVKEGRGSGDMEKGKGHLGFDMRGHSMVEEDIVCWVGWKSIFS